MPLAPGQFRWSSTEIGAIHAAKHTRGSAFGIRLASWPGVFRLLSGAFGRWPATVRLCAEIVTRQLEFRATILGRLCCAPARIRQASCRPEPAVVVVVFAAAGSLVASCQHSPGPRAARDPPNYWAPAMVGAGYGRALLSRPRARLWRMRAAACCAHQTVRFDSAAAAAAAKFAGLRAVRLLASSSSSGVGIKFVRCVELTSLAC